jgi:hypothetical protein
MEPDGSGFEIGRGHPQLFNAPLILLDGTTLHLGETA